MSSTGVIDDVEEVIVVRVNHESIILQVLYHNKEFAKLAKKISGRRIGIIGLKATICKQCEDYLNKVFLQLKKKAFQLHIRSRWYRISYLPEWNDKNQVATVLIIVRDITTEQNLKEELKINHAKLKMVQQIAMLGYFERDVANDKLCMSDEAHKNFNLAPQIQSPSMDLLLSHIHPADVELIRNLISQRKPECLLELEYRIVKRDGSIRWIHNLVQSIFDDNGELSKQFGITQDITKWKLIEIKLKGMTEQLQQANQLLTAKQISAMMAGKIAKVGYFEWDQANDHICWSEQQYRNYGYTPEEVAPTRELLRRRIHPDDWDVVESALAQVSEKLYMEYQFRVIKVDGSLGWLYSRANFIIHEQGGKIFGTTQDITEQKKAEQRMSTAEKQLNFTNRLYSRSTYLNRLLFENFPVEQITKALNEFGIETQVAHCCFVVQLAEKLPYNTENLEESMPSLITRKQAVLTWLAERECGLVWRCHDDIVVLSLISDHIAGDKQSQIKVADDIIVAIEKEFPCFYVKVGISGTSDIPINFRGSYEKAHRAVIVATSMNHSSAIHGDDIGLYEVAFQLLQDKNTCQMVQNTIGRLAGHDEARGSNLLITLESILEYGNLKTVALKLFIHPNTVIWRKRRIEEFLDMPLDKMEAKLLLLLYIKIWNLKKKILS